MSLEPVITLAFPILTILVGGFCILQIGMTRALRDTVGDLRGRVGDLEAEQVRDKATIVEQAAEIMALRKIVTGEAQLEAIAEVLNDHHGQATAFWANANRVLAHADETLTDLVTQLGDQKGGAA